MTGLDLMRAFVDSRAPAPGIAKLLGFTFDAVDQDTATMSIEIGPQHYNPMGTLHGGVLCDIGDAAMGCAVATTLAEGETYTTIELRINFFKPVHNGVLRAIGTVIRRTRSLAYAECEVRDHKDSLVAKLSSTCMYLRGDAARGR